MIQVFVMDYFIEYYFSFYNFIIHLLSVFLNIPGYLVTKSIYRLKATIIFYLYIILSTF